MELQVQTIIDSYLKEWIENGLNKLPLRYIPEEMQSPTESYEKEWKTWLPISSTVTKDQLSQLERQIGYQLPISYKLFLMYKHFYDLHIEPVSFFRHPSEGWQACLLEALFNGYSREYLIDKGYMPFADYSDWGLMCFNLNEQATSSECPIVLWDHEKEDTFKKKYDHFNQMLIRLDEQNRKNIT